MPRRSGRTAKSDTCLVPFHYIVTSSLNSGAGVFNVSPNSTLSPRSATEADAWAHFRVRSFAFRLPPRASTLNPIAAGYVGALEDTPPATIANVMELLPAVYLPGAQTIPSDWVRPSRADLAGPFPWYKTVPGTADATEEQPGQVVIAGSTTEAYSVEVKGVFEFKTSVATANTPVALEAHRMLMEDRRQRVVARERASLMRVLAPEQRVPTPTSAALAAGKS